MKLAIGMPVYERAWCLPRWFEAMERQELPPRTDVSFHFAVSPSDDGTMDMLMDWTGGYVACPVGDLPSFCGRSNTARYSVLAEIRNRLLDQVRRYEADYYLSVDSDMILDPGAIRALLECAEVTGAGVVGALIDMLGVWPVMTPSAMELEPDGKGGVHAVRWKPEDIPDRPFRVGVPMAVKLFSRRAIERGSYWAAPQGEDIGLGMDLELLNVSRWIEPRATARHLYHRDDAPVAA